MRNETKEETKLNNIYQKLIDSPRSRGKEIRDFNFYSQSHFWFFIFTAGSF